MENRESISKKIREQQNKIDEEREEIENYLGRKWLRFLKLLHPKIRQRLKELASKQESLNQTIQENMELIQIEALEESKRRYGWELLLTEKELSYLENLERITEARENPMTIERINTNLKRKYGRTLKDVAIIPNYLVHLALKYNIGIVDRKKAEKLFYNFVYAAPYNEWGLEYNRETLAKLLEEKIRQTREFLIKKIADIDEQLNSGR